MSDDSEISTEDVLVKKPVLENENESDSEVSTPASESDDTEVSTSPQKIAEKRVLKDDVSVDSEVSTESLSGLARE